MLLTSDSRAGSLFNIAFLLLVMDDKSSLTGRSGEKAVTLKWVGLFTVL
jgi:hypothetical protein